MSLVVKMKRGLPGGDGVLPASPAPLAFEESLGDAAELWEEPQGAPGADSSCCLQGESLGEHASGLLAAAAVDCAEDSGSLAVAAKETPAESVPDISHALQKQELKRASLARGKTCSKPMS